MSIEIGCIYSFRSEQYQGTCVPRRTRESQPPRQFPVETHERNAVQPTGLESELKLEVSARHLDTLRRDPLFRNRNSSGKHELISIYFDTKDRVLRQHGLSFRLRRKGSQLFRTIKGTYRGMLDRAELETLFIYDTKVIPVQLMRFCSILIKTYQQH